MLHVLTGSSRDVGESMFEACNGNLELAVDMHMEGGENSRRAGASAAAGTSMASTSHNDEVRAPIPQRTETLVEDAPSYGFRGRRRAARSVFDGFRDFQAETRQQEAMRSVTRNSAKRKTLEDLFRPPIDLIHKGTFSSARDLGTSKSCWLMVNVQNVQEFACQALNRDVWSNSAVKSIIKQHFVFWQVYHDSEEGRKYMQFYKISDWPYVAVLDPRTGENMAVWSKLDNMTFCDLVTEFLAQNPSLDGSLTSSPPAKRKKRENSIVDASEDAQMMAAIQASLKEESSKSPTSKPETVTLSDSDISDSDDLETFSDSDEKSSNASPVKKPKLDSEKTSCRKQNLTSKLANSEQSKPSPKKACNNSPGKKCSKRRRSSSDKEEENCNKKEHSSSKSDSGTAKEERVVETLPERWRNYLGKADDCPATLMFRYPDGSREQLCIPHTSQLWALVYFVIEKGYSNEQYELVTQFPRRRISDLDLDSTLQQSGLHQRETVFVQSR